MEAALVLQVKDNTVAFLLSQNKVKVLKHRIGFPVEFRLGTRYLIREPLRKLHLGGGDHGVRIRSLMRGGI